jgi:hypothetical protein
MTTLEFNNAFNQHLADLKAVKNRTIVLLGQDHYITHELMRSVQYGMRAMEKTGMTINHSLQPVIDVSTLNDLKEVQTYLQGLLPQASQISEFFVNTSLPQKTMFAFIQLQNVYNYESSLGNAALYN